MAKLSDESLNKLKKPELIAFSMYHQEKNKSIQRDMKDEVRELKEYVKKLEGELALSKSISELLSDRRVGETVLVSAWKWLEYLKVFQQVTWKKLFLKFWRKLEWKFH